MTEAAALMTFDEYLAFEETSAVRHDFIGGHVYAMAGGSERHDLAAGLAYEALAPGARRLGCRPFSGNRKLVCGHSTYYPDMFVSCGKAAHTHYETDAGLIIEVLSPSTASIDKREKLLAYAGLPSLEQYLLIDPYYRSIREAVPDGSDAGFGWHDHGPGDVVITAFGPISVDDLYDEIDATATT